MNVNLGSEPFSRFGSYLCFNVLPPGWHQPGLIFRTMRGVFGVRELLRFELARDGAPIPSTPTATPSLLTLAADDGSAKVDICFADERAVRVRGSGATLRMSSIDDHRFVSLPVGDDAWVLNGPKQRTHLYVTRLSGRLSVEAVRRVRTQDKSKKERPVTGPWLVVEACAEDGGSFELAIEECQTSPKRVGLDGSFDDCAAAATRAWDAFAAKTPAVPEAYLQAAERAMYVNWSAVVAPSNCLTRTTMLMSKNWMNQSWTWDHCINAMALSYEDPDLAWDQLVVPFDHQDEHGSLPDSVCSVRVSWNFVKPPIHGWTLSKMTKNPALLTDERARGFYEPLAQWTRWWMTARDTDGNGIPEYFHGNDSGWDNGTVFDGGFPTAAPDLSAYLVLQMDALSELATGLGKTDDAARWKADADALLDRMIAYLWNGSQFVSKKARTDEAFPNGDCLLNFIPIILGDRLGEPQRGAVAEALEPGGRFVTDYGPATENPQSDLYVPDGYWRGPIWGPETVMVVDGLARAGYAEHAKEIARRYCDMCVANGFAENYDALTGEALRDKAYTWGSSAFLILAHEFLGA
jgi:glycogen debranching enzyme